LLAAVQRQAHFAEISVACSFAVAGLTPVEELPRKAGLCPLRWTFAAAQLLVWSDLIERRAE